jgi:hypothetical protein
MMGNPDDLRNNYNNCYIYFRADNGKMMIIPYDMDRGLGVNKDWNPSGNHMTTDSPFNNTAIGNGNSTQKNPLFSKGILNSNFYRNEYVEALKLVDASELLKISTFEARFNLAKSLYSNDVKTSKKYDNAGNGVSFNISKSDGSNMSFADYLTAKRATLYKYIGDQGNTDNTKPDDGGDTPVTPPDPITNCKPYIMGDMSGWAVNGNYAMKSNGDGIFTFTLTSSMAQSYDGRQKIKFKLFDDNNDVWYGGEIIDPNCTVSYDDNNGNRNIYLDPGTYLVTFDANTVTLYIEKK